MSKHPYITVCVCVCVCVCVHVKLQQLVQSAFVCLFTGVRSRVKPVLAISMSSKSQMRHFVCEPALQ